MKGPHLSAVFQSPAWVLQLTEACSLTLFFFFHGGTLPSNWWFCLLEFTSHKAVRNRMQRKLMCQQRKEYGEVKQLIFSRHKSHFHQVQAVSCYCRSLRYNELFSAVRGRHQAAVIKSMVFPSLLKHYFSKSLCFVKTPFHA